MKPLNLSYRIFVWLSMCHTENKASRWTKIIRFGLFLAIVTNFSLVFLSSVLFCQQNMFNNLEIAIFAIFQMIAAATLIHSMVTAYVLREEITNIFKSLQQIYDEGEPQNGLFDFHITAF